MTKTNFYLQTIVLFSTLAFSNSSFSPLPVEAEAESLQSIPLEWENSQSSPDFSGDGRPKRTAGGASRSQCLAENDVPLTAIVPDTSVALTAAKSPTFWFYLPNSLTSKHSVEFVLKDDRDKYIYKTELAGEKVSSGIIGLQLPATITLNAKHDYHWYFLVHCQARNKFVYVNGSVRRIETPNLDISNSLPQEQLNFYASQGLWYDAMTNVAEQMSANPQNPTNQDNWATLLQSVELNELIHKPVVSLEK